MNLSRSWNKLLKSKVLKILSAIFPLLILIFAVAFLKKTIHTFSWLEIKTAFASISPDRIVIAALLTALNYLVMIGYDRYGLLYAGEKPPFSKTATASFIGNSLNSNLGFSAVLGSIIKLRYFSRWGVAPQKVIIAVIIYSIANWLGFFFLSSISLLSAPAVLHFFSSRFIQNFTGVLLALPVPAYFLFLLIFKNVKLPGGLHLKSPAISTGVLLFITGVLDWVLHALIFFVLIPSVSFAQFPTFASSFAFSHLAGLLSQVPGGIAVFESATLMLSGVNQSSLIGPLILFRLFFFIVPGVLALIGFVLLEILHRKKVAL